jgi:hypothetical protein
LWVFQEAGCEYPQVPWTSAITSYDFFLINLLFPFLSRGYYLLEATGWSGARPQGRKVSGEKQKEPTAVCLALLSKT